MFSYSPRVHVFSDVSFSFRSNSLNFVVGSSGAGKSTLLSLIYGSLKPSYGDILLRGYPVRRFFGSILSRYRQLFGIVYQDFFLFDEMTIRQNILLPLLISERKLPRSELYYINRVGVLAEDLDIMGILDEPAGLTSEGERQRAAVARALLLEPPIIIADEPTANMDEDRAILVFKSLNNLVIDRKSIVMCASHDNDLVNWTNSATFRIDTKSVVQIK